MTPPRWLSGPVADVPPLLQPVAHALLETADEIRRVSRSLDPVTLRARPGGVAPVAFHLLHLAGSSERLFAYARDRELTVEQRARLALEKMPDEIPLEGLVEETVATLEALVDDLTRVAPEVLLEPRGVGAKRLPSTVLGLLVHAAEHAQRHCGQLVTTVRVVRGGEP